MPIKINRNRLKLRKKPYFTQNRQNLETFLEFIPKNEKQNIKKQIKQILSCEKCQLHRESDEQHLHFSLDFGAAKADALVPADRIDGNSAEAKPGERPKRSCKDIVRSYAEGLRFSTPCESHGAVYMSQKVNRATQEVFFSCDFEHCQLFKFLLFE